MPARCCAGGSPATGYLAGVKVAFEEPTLWERYRWYVLGALTISALQALVAGGLVLERRRRIRAQAELIERQRLEKLAELEARRTLDQLAHVSRVGALGELAASLAHELNQPLAAILSNAQAARRLLDANPAELGEVREALGDIISDDKRAGEVIHRMRAMLKQGQPRDEFHSLNDLVREVARLLANDMQLRGATLHLVLAPSLPAVRGDGIQLQQVVLNLLINALDAMAELPAGQRQLWLRTASVDPKQVELSVQDSGAGIEPSRLPLIFEPFYTTKEQGLGMGLSISRSIIEAHGGQLLAESLPGQGALLRCLLPVVPSNAPVMTPEPSATIFLVDDDDSVLAGPGAALEGRGLCNEGLRLALRVPRAAARGYAGLRRAGPADARAERAGAAAGHGVQALPPARHLHLRPRGRARQRQGHEGRCRGLPPEAFR